MAEGGAPCSTQENVLNGGRAAGVNLNHQEKVNYEQATSLLINTGGRVLRRVFIRYCDENRGHNDLNQFIEDIRSLVVGRNILKYREQKEMLQEDIDKWDISLLTIILTFYYETDNERLKICNFSQEIEKHVEKFRWLRNDFLCHVPQTTLQEGVFQEFKRGFRVALFGLLDHINDAEFRRETDEDVKSTISGEYSFEQAFKTLKAWLKSDNKKNRERVQHMVSSDPETMQLMYDVLKTNPKVKALEYGFNSGVRLCDDMDSMWCQEDYTTWKALGCTFMECKTKQDTAKYGYVGAVLFDRTTSCYLPVSFVVNDLTRTEAVAEVALVPDIKSTSVFARNYQQLALKITLSVGSGNRLILNVACKGETGENNTKNITLSDHAVGDRAVCAIGLKISGSSKTITILDHETGKVLITEDIDFGSHPIRPMFSVFRSKVICGLRTRVCLPKCFNDPNLTENMEIFKQEHLEFDPISLHSDCSVTERQLPYFSNTISLQTNVTSARARDGPEVFQKYTGGLIRNLQLHTKSVVYICFMLQYPECEANELKKEIKLAEISLCDHEHIQTYTNTSIVDKRGESLTVRITAKGSGAALVDTGATKTRLIFDVEYSGKLTKSSDEYEPTSNVAVLGVLFVGPKRTIHIINVENEKTIATVERKKKLKSNLIPVVGVFYENTYVSVPGTP